MMKKIKVIGLGNDEKRNFFVIEKENLFLSLFPIFLESLGLRKTGLLNQYVEEKYEISENVDLVENTKNKDYDLDIFYGEHKIIVVIRTDLNNREKIISEIKKIATNPGFE